MKFKSGLLISGLVLLIAAANAQAAGPHEDCKMCHKSPDEEPYQFTVTPDTKTQNPKTSKPISGVSAICFSCHKEGYAGENAGVPINLSSSHPIGVVPSSRVSVPKDVLEFNGEKGLLSCGSCHNWHPDNKNYKYLRWEVSGRYDLNRFCSQCHKNKANPAGKGSHGECAICHSSHEGRGMVMLTEEPNTVTVNPQTKKPLDGVDSLCMACHATEPDGAGYRPINLATSHPVGGKPEKAKLPAEMGNNFNCISCHDEHPINQNYAYLRWPMKSTKDIPELCGRCHPESKEKIAEGVKHLSSPSVGIHTKYKNIKTMDDYLNSLKPQEKQEPKKEEPKKDK